MNRSTWFSAVTALTLGLSQSFGQEAHSRQSEVERLSRPLVDGHLVPSLAIGIYEDGHTETYGLGVISKEKPHAPDANTVYELGSVSKVFTALLLAEAVTRNEVTLDTPLSKLLPPDIKPPKWKDQEITLEELATHFSGLPRIPSNMVAESLVNPYQDYGKDKLFAFLNGYEISHEPGKAYEYSNLGMGLLGTLLADKAGMDYEKLLNDRITKPLGMGDTAITLSKDQQNRLAPPNRNGVRVSNWDFKALAGCGAIRSTVNDLVKLVAANVDPASTPLKASIQFEAKRRRGIPGTPKGMALGWQIAGDGSTLWHTGQTGGYSTAVFVNPLLRKGVVVLANGADSAVDELGEKLFQALAGMNVQPPKVRGSILLPDSQLKRLTGDYTSPYGFVISVTQTDDALFAQLTGQGALRIHAESPTNFFYRDVAADLQFELDSKGESATAVTLLQNGKVIRCPRKP